jgi:serine/threonine-protein kinase
MRLCAEVGAALAAAHAEGLVHRDIKPANVMLASTGAKVVDFGIAAAITQTGSGTDEVFGTPSYLAPERMTDDAVQPASDVFSLGVLLYRLLSGQSPWTMDTTTQLLAAHIHIDPAPLSPASPVPDHIVELCMRCLSRFPADRPSASEAARLLAHAAGLAVVPDETTGNRARALAAAGTALPPDPAGTAGPSVVIRPSVPPAPKRRPSKNLLIAGAFAVAALAMAGWALIPGGETPVPAAAPSQSAAAEDPLAATPEPSTSLSARPVTSTTAKATSQPTRTTATRRNPTAPATRTTTTPPVVTTTAPTTAAPEPVQRTFTSEAGVVVGTCTAPSTAQILSATATKPFKIKQIEAGPGAAPRVVFKHGSDLVTVVVTCSDGEPSAS